MVHKRGPEVGCGLRLGRRVAEAEPARAEPEVHGAQAAERVAIRLPRRDAVLLAPELRHAVRAVPRVHHAAHLPYEGAVRRHRVFHRRRTPRAAGGRPAGSARLLLLLRAADAMLARLVHHVDAGELLEREHALERREVAHCVRVHRV